MANEQNLRPARSKSEARERGALGGKKSGEARRRKKTMRELLEIAMEQPGDKQNTTAEAITAALIGRALAGDVKAYEVIRDTLGENPKVKVDNQISGDVSVQHKVSPAISGLLECLAEGKTK